jgi:heptosyltransferase-2
MKILIIQNKKIGDVLTTSVLFKAIKDNLNYTEMHYFVYSNALSVINKNPNIDKIWHCKEEEFTGIKGVLKWYTIFKKENFDLIIDAYAKLSTLSLVKLLNPGNSISFKKFYSNLFVKTSIKRLGEPKTSATLGIEHRLQLVEPILGETNIYKPKIYLDKSELNNAKQRLLKNSINPKKALIMISILGSENSKTYPYEYMASLLDFLVNYDHEYSLLLNYIPNQKNQVQNILNLCKSKTRKNIHQDFYSSDLREFICVTKHCKALIGNEGGATNIAKAIEIPTFTIFSPNIKKKDWNIFEDGRQNISVHVDDYFDTKAQNYDNFEPSLFYDKLKFFCKLNLQK